MNINKILIINIFIFLAFSVNAQNLKNDTIDNSVPQESLDKSTFDEYKEFRYKSKDQKKDVLVSSIFGNSRRLSNADSLLQALDRLPSFGIYKDNYFVAGTELFQTPTQWNSDAKFQISIRQRLTNSTLPFKTFLFLTYTQKAFWDVFKDSFPFRDLNYNPTIGIGKALVYNNRFLGYVSFQLEHESNGKDGADSRSWNKMSFSSSLLLQENWVLEADVWIPFVDGEENADLVKYAGWCNVNLEYTSPNQKFVFNASVTKRGGVNLNTNITLSAAIRLMNDDNQFLFVEFYNGYGESMLDYKQFRQRLRAGFVIKPRFLNFY